MEIQINYYDITDFLQHKSIFAEVSKWIVKKINLPIISLNIIFVSDSFLMNLHKKYFDLDTKTDVITFNLNESENDIEGEIYISIDRAQEQSKQFNVSPEVEICRLIVHGCLHLAGYNDENESDIVIMKDKENTLVDEVINVYNNKLHVEVN